MPPPDFVDAHIDVTLGVNDFVPVNGNSLKLSKATFKLRGSPDGVGQPSPQLFEVGKKANLMFVFSSEFTPQDIWFLQTAPGQDRDPDGKINLQERKPDETRHMIAVKDLLVNRHKHARWKILIPIRNSKGEVGLVDPEISNTDESLA